METDIGLAVASLAFSVYNVATVEDEPRQVARIKNDGCLRCEWWRSRRRDYRWRWVTRALRLLLASEEMTSVRCFSLETRGESPDSFLLRDGERTGTLVPGVEIVKQYVVGNGRYLLITDYDDPWEEITEIVLLDGGNRVLARRRLGSIGTVFARKTYAVKDVQWLEEDEFVTIPHDPAKGYYRCVIRPFGIPFIYPRLQTRFFSEWERFG